MDGGRTYHHGNLREALVAAAEAELEANGIEGFSLRGVARRAGVSHAAPAHHFGDARGLLTALAADGFRRFVATQEARQAEAALDPRSQLVAAGLGYIEFARRHHALFRLMFSSDRPQGDDEALKAAGRAAYEKLVRDVSARMGETAPSTVDIVAVWAAAHGVADLLASGRAIAIARLPEAEREAAFAQILDRSIAGG
jgi:AcrR family transcriptional regulator